MRALSVFLLVCSWFTGCGHRERLGANCEWPEGTATALDLRDQTDRRHLSNDALRAEDLAIRYADSLKAPHSGHFEGFASYRQTRDTCMTALFSAVARSHGVSTHEVRKSLARRPAGLDLAVMLSFAVFYGFVAYGVTRGVCRGFPLEGGWDSAVAVVATMVTSILVSVLGVLVGEWYALAIEMIRVGNGHLSYRVDRIPWNQHRAELFFAGVAVFWLIAGLRYRASGGGSVGPETLRDGRLARR